jgi:DNA (cytosine-5)-methyltransferase 1
VAQPKDYSLTKKKYSVLEICAGAGGQALGLEQAGFETACAVEIDKDACQTLRLNRPKWNVVEADLKNFSASKYREVDLLAGGVPCPPFSLAGKQLGADDDRDLFPTALRLIRECDPKAVLLENVRGLSSPKFLKYREWIITELGKMGYETFWDLVLSSNFGVPQLRPRFVLVAVKNEYSPYFKYPTDNGERSTVSETILDLIKSDNWNGASQWAKKASKIAPTIVGGSKKHGGADLGPTRAKRQWLELGVDGKGIANAPPQSSDSNDFIPKLTNQMVARIQGFPSDWEFAGKKTSQYRQIGNAFPPPVAQNFGKAIIDALDKRIRNYEIGEQKKLT